MRLVWLLALIACVLFSVLFSWTLVYYFMHYEVTWRVIALIAVVVFWGLLTRQAFLKFMRVARSHS
jgi:hypothetical protein